MSRRHLILVALIAAATGAIFFGWRFIDQSISALDSNPALSTERVELGRKIYVANCAACHGDKLQGEPNWQERTPDGLLPAPPHDMTGHTWHHPDQQLFKITKLGVEAMVPNYKSEMAGFGASLTDAEIWNVIAYIKSTWPADIQAQQRTVTENATAQGLGPSGAQ